jgi:hypothetical protein
MALRSLAAALAAACVFTGAGVAAQTTTATITRTEPLTIPEEQEVVVRQYISRRPVTRIIEVPGGVQPGGVIPRDIRLSPLADIPVPALSRYAYFISPEDKIVIVDPATRQVMSVISR